MILLTKQDVADALKVSLRTVDRIREDGRLKSVRVRNQIRFRQSDVDAYIRKHLTK